MSLNSWPWKNKETLMPSVHPQLPPRQRQAGAEDTAEAPRGPPAWMRQDRMTLDLQTSHEWRKGQKTTLKHNGPGKQKAT